MEIRPTRPEDLPQILALYDTARAFMRQNGNLTQWSTGDRPNSMAERDILEGRSFVCCEGTKLLAVFSFEPDADDPTYHEIWDGAWPDDGPYGVMHRLAVGVPGRGIAQLCFDWCAARCASLRADTHADNHPMQRAMEKNGFRRCGIIHTFDGTDRIAYSRPATIWLSQSEKKRRELLAAIFGLYGLAIALVLAVLFDLLITMGVTGLLLLPLLVAMALPGYRSASSLLRKEGGIGIGPEGIENRLAEKALHGSYAWSDFCGAEFGRREKTIELYPRESAEFFASLPKKARRTLRQRRVKNQTLPLSCLLLTKADRKRLLWLLKTNLEARNPKKN